MGQRLLCNSGEARCTGGEWYIVDVPVIVGTTQGWDEIGRASPGHPADGEDGSGETVEDEETSNSVIWLRYRSKQKQTCRTKTEAYVAKCCS